MPPIWNNFMAKWWVAADIHYATTGNTFLWLIIMVISMQCEIWIDVDFERLRVDPFRKLKSDRQLDHVKSNSLLFLPTRSLFICIHLSINSINELHLEALILHELKWTGSGRSAEKKWITPLLMWMSDVCDIEWVVEHCWRRSVVQWKSFESWKWSEHKEMLEGNVKRLLRPPAVQQLFASIWIEYQCLNWWNNFSDLTLQSYKPHAKSILKTNRSNTFDFTTATFRRIL